MFNAVVHRGKRSLWSARTVAVSVGAHLLVLVWIAVAAANTNAEIYIPSDCMDCGVDWQVRVEDPLNWPRPGETPAPLTPELAAAVTGASQPGTTTQPSVGNAGLLPDSAEIFDPTEVAQLPELLDLRAAQRMLERVYPPLLRDAGVTGYTRVQLVVDRTGAVEPGSVTVQETTHDGFREAAVRAAERFRFRPARVNALPVRVRISLPIRWTLRH
jgi:TonB family protein